MTSKRKRLPKILKESKVVEVEAYERTIYAREYYIICKKCNRDVARKTFGGVPQYCEQCRPPKSDTVVDYGNKKLPRPVLVQVDNASQKSRRSAAGE